MTRGTRGLTGSDGLPVRETGRWVYDKNYYIERYFDIFSRGVGKKWKGKLAYVDLFAGVGRNFVRENKDEVDGSPLLALKHGFAKYVFVDKPHIMKVLEKRISGHPKRSMITTLAGDCNDVISDVLAVVPSNHLTLAFIDPTGIHIKFEAIRRLVVDRKVDLLMTIQFGMAIRMNLRQYLKADRAALDSFMGTKNWRDDYREGESISQIGRRVLERYRNQLTTLKYTTVRDREIEVRSDARNLFLYVIVLASRHALGAEYWRKVTAVAPSGQRRLNLQFEG